MKDYYQILGIPETASEEQIKKAYRSLAKKYHPDVNQGNKAAENKFKEISEANEVLSNKQKRAQFDQMRRYGAGGPFGGYGGGARSGAGAQGGPGAQEYNFDDLSSIFGEFGGFGSFADIFSSIFGESGGVRSGRATSTRSKRPTKGEDLFGEIEIPADTALKGGRANINTEITERCPVCHGTGAKPGAGVKTCPECGGRGVINFMQGNFSVSRPCPRCLGRGQIVEEFCANCKGTGRVKKPREISIKIPAGIESSKTIRLKGLGEQGNNGGPPGDLYLKIDFIGSPAFRRDGLDIHSCVSISSDQATHGGKVRVSTFNNQQIDLKIPAGTKSGSQFRLRGLGLAQGGHKGDLIVEVDIKP